LIVIADASNSRRATGESVPEVKFVVIKRTKSLTEVEKPLRAVLEFLRERAVNFVDGPDS
jgi:hypothetical protein